MTAMTGPTVTIEADDMTVTRGVTAVVSGHPPIQQNWGERFFFPRHVHVSWVDGVISGVSVSGPSIKKDGSAGVAWLGRSWWRSGNEEWPEWLAALVADLEHRAPTRVTVRKADR